jgi:hypothetical protein
MMEMFLLKYIPEKSPKSEFSGILF